MPTPASSSLRQTAIKKEAAYAAGTGAIAIKCFENDATQAVRIPKAFELPDTQTLMHREDYRLILKGGVDDLARLGVRHPLLICKKKASTARTTCASSYQNHSH